MQVYDVFTDLDPEQLTQVAAETYYRWLQFALGKAEIGGKKLKHPSGRYAAALSWKKTGVARIAIIADENAAKEIGILETGHAEFSLKDQMLAPGRPGVRVSKEGYPYRRINLSGSVWARERRVHTMSAKPGSSPWKIPAMPAYAPGAILAAELKQQYGRP